MSTKNVVEVEYNTLKQQIEQGFKIDDLAQHYSLSKNKMREILKKCNLRIRKFKGPAYVIKGMPDELNNVEESTEVKETIDEKETTKKVEEKIINKDEQLKEAKVINDKPEEEILDDIFKETKPKKENKEVVKEPEDDEEDEFNLEW